MSKASNLRRNRKRQYYKDMARINPYKKVHLEDFRTTGKSIEQICVEQVETIMEKAATGR